jgi:hypothetical protein
MALDSLAYDNLANRILIAALGGAAAILAALERYQHTHTHARTHARTHAHTHTHTHAHTHTHTHTLRLH